MVLLGLCPGVLAAQTSDADTTAYFDPDTGKAAEHYEKMSRRAATTRVNMEGYVGGRKNNTAWGFNANAEVTAPVGKKADITAGVIDTFRALSRHPHPSRREEETGEDYMELLRGLGLSPVRDGAGNVMADCPATPGRETEPLLILRENAATHDFPVQEDVLGHARVAGLDKFLGNCPYPCSVPYPRYIACSVAFAGIGVDAADEIYVVFHC